MFDGRKRRAVQLWTYLPGEEDIVIVAGSCRVITKKQACFWVRAHGARLAGCIIVLLNKKNATVTGCRIGCKQSNVDQKVQRRNHFILRN